VIFHQVMTFRDELPDLNTPADTTIPCQRGLRQTIATLSDERSWVASFAAVLYESAQIIGGQITNNLLANSEAATQNLFHM
jgi:hypothetical protein